MTDFFEAPDGRRIAYVDSGDDGPAVLCLNGLTRTMRSEEHTSELQSH